MSRENTGLGSDYLQSLDRGLRVLRAFSRDTPRLTVTQAAEAADVPRPTARRILLTLEYLSYLRSQAGEYYLSPRVLELGYSYLAGLRVAEVARPHLEGLVAAVGESASLAVLDDTMVVFADRVESAHMMRTVVTVGTRLPAYTTAVGRALLSGLPDDEMRDILERSDRLQRTESTLTDLDKLFEVVQSVRARGWAISDQEFETGVRAIAAPVHDTDGRTVAAVSIASHAGRVSLEQVETELSKQLLNRVRKIEEHLQRSAGVGGPDRAAED